MSERIDWKKLINKQIGKFNPRANQYFKNEQDHFQFLALVKVKYEKQSILTVTEFKHNFYKACQQRIGQFEIDNERSEYFGCLVSITFIQLFICKRNNFKLDQNINKQLNQKKYNHYLWKTGKKYDLKYLNKIIYVFDKFYNDDKRETNVEEIRIMYSFKNEEYLSLTKSDKLNYDTEIYNKYFKSYIEDIPEENDEDSSDEEEEIENEEERDNDNSENTDVDLSEDESDNEDATDNENEEPTESDDDFTVDDNRIEYEPELIEELKEENNDLVTENEDLIQNNKDLKKSLNNLEQSERNNKRKISVFEQSERNYNSRISQLEANRKYYKRKIFELEKKETTKKRRIDILEDNEDKLENDKIELNNVIDDFVDKNDNLKEDNKTLRKRLRIEGQYANYWLGGKFKTYIPFIDWLQDSDL